MHSVPQQARHADDTEIATAEIEQSVTTPLSLFGEKVEIRNLETLKLSSINVQKIWSGQASRFCFQNLIKLTVKGCRNLTYLCSLSVASNLEKLKGLFVSDCPLMEKLFICEEENSMNYSEVCIFPKLEEIQLTYMNMLKNIWPAEVGADSFPSLISVHIGSCDKLDIIFPSHMEGWHRSLESLEVASCESVKVIFEIGCPLAKDASGAADTKLQSIYLGHLRNLEQMWSRDPEGVFNFTVLRSINVSSCYKMRDLLPASVAKGLGKLEELQIWWCDKMEEIVKWVAGSETSNEPLRFPELTSAEFFYLGELRCFYEGRHNIECPKLKRLSVNECPKLETFTTVFLAEKVISNLEHLDIDSKDAVGLQSNIGKYRLHRLKQLSLQSLPSTEILYWFLNRTPNLEMLDLYDPDIRELVPSTAPQQSRLGAVLQLKELTLYDAEIEDVGFERDQVLQRLERLALFDCTSLIKLAQSTVSLTHLTFLEVDGCSGLKSLMASSTAKTLVQLTTMKVVRCDEVEEIVTNERNEEETVLVEDIKFGKLVTLELVELKSLTSFYSYKNCVFSFPSLEKLIFRDCPKMKMFTESQVRAPKLNILVTDKEDEKKWYWEGDLNAIVKKVYADKVDKIAESACKVENLELGGSSRFQEMWQGSMPVPDACFSNLKSLIVDGCEFLSQVLPSHLLPFLSKMQKLVARNCSSVKTIFDVKCIKKGKSPLLFSLNHLVLTKLPNLECVWNEDPDENLEITFPCLTSLTLLDLPKLECFYCCAQLKIFTGQNSHTEDQVCVKELSLGEKELKKIWHGQCQGNHLNKVKVLGLQGFNVADEVPCGFLQKVPNTEKLVVRDSSSLKEIFCSERPPNVDYYTEFLPQLKGLELDSLSELISIGLEHSWVQESFLKNLETLKASSCSRLRKLVPSPVCFSNLTNLTVYYCDDMVHLFTSSTAKSLAQLRKMDISGCKSIREIVSKEGDDESHHDHEIIFGQLQELSLKYLLNLRSFYNGRDTLSFPSLEKLSLVECRRMDTFCAGTVNANKLSAVELNYRDATPLEVDLNFTIRQAFPAKGLD